MPKDLLARIEQGLQASLGETKDPTNLYSPIVYSLENGGKRLRPLLAMLAFSCFNDQLDEVVPLASALEVFHTFTLLHDDIMDNAAMRRGAETVHVKYGLSQAILSGDAMYALALCRLGESPEEKLPFLLRQFSAMTLDIMRGQQLDIDFEAEDSITLAMYLKMIHWKTAVLFASALQLGAYLGGASQEVSEIFYQSGIKMGLAFQLRDDYLDVYGDGSQFGKPLGGDILEDKKTWLSIRAKQEDEKQHSTLFAKAQAIASPQEKVATMRSVYDYYQLPQEGEVLIGDYTEEAVDLIKGLEVAYPPALEELEKLFYRLAGRTT